MSDDQIYLDYAATSPVDPRVRDKMLECLSPDGPFGNPASEHFAGRRARRVIDDARAQVAAVAGLPPDSVVFTSGATEANNLALRGMFPERCRKGAHFVTSRIEHRSVLDVARYLERVGVRVTLVDSDELGRIDPDAVGAAMTGETRLVSIMQVNNEVGTVQDIEAIATICRRRGVPLHVDAAQGAGKVSLDVGRIGIDLCSLTAHKICGPKGVGALCVRRGLALDPILFGGAQERGLRPGTQAPHQLAGMGKAFELVAAESDAARIGAQRDRLWQGLEQIDGARRNGDPDRAVPHILNVSFPGVDGESLRLALSGIAVSQGSACASASPEPSHVLSALGLSDTRAQSSLRFGIGRFTTDREIDRAVDRIATAVIRLRRLADGAPTWCSA